MPGNWLWLQNNIFIFPHPKSVLNSVVDFCIDGIGIRNCFLAYFVYLDWLSDSIDSVISLISVYMLLWQGNSLIEHEGWESNRTIMILNLICMMIWNFWNGHAEDYLYQYIYAWLLNKLRVHGKHTGTLCLTLKVFYLRNVEKRKRERKRKIWWG